MARILILTHEYDDPTETPYLIKGLIPPWRQMGHSVRVAKGLAWGEDADIVVVHVDVSVVPEDYRRYAGQFPAGVNRRAVDIRKRTVSRILLQRSDTWDGQVIVKSDLNFGGVGELRHNEIASAFDLDAPYPALEPAPGYDIYPSLDTVPEAVWNDPRYVMERFLPERDERGYWLHCWVFLGDAERCNRYCAPEPIVKFANFTLQEPAAVPEELRVERERLGFDYGKFDFVVHEGRPVLLDANRTPGAAANIRQDQEAGAFHLAAGINSLLKR
jgi:hypothetical protein